MPTFTTLKERLQKSSLSKLDATLEHLLKNPPSSGPGWYGHGMQGGPCVWRESRLRALHHTRMAALETVIRTKRCENEKLIAKKEKLKERNKEKAKKARAKARAKARKAARRAAKK